MCYNNVMITITKPYKDDMIIPISVAMIGDELNIDVYEEYLSVAEDYLKKYEGCYFSDEALTFISENIRPEGYIREDDPTEYYLVFSANGKQPVLTDVVDIGDAVYEVDETEFEADMIKEEGQPASLIVRDGRIAAISAANYFIDDEEEVELAVETLEDFRGLGYAKAVLSDMVNKVLKMGKTPTYRASRFNEASIATAKSCGFREIGKEF